MSHDVRINLFGAFREFSTQGFLTLSLSGEEKARDIKKLLNEKISKIENAKFDVAALMDKSVLATHQKILDDDETVSVGELSILPPVCGG